MLSGNFENDPPLGTFSTANTSADMATTLQKRAKRTFDVLFAMAALISFGIPMLVIALIMKLTVGGPVIYAHRRVGLDGRLFPCLKYRTMLVDADERLEHLLATDPEAAEEFAESQKLRNDPRIIPYIGQFLRKTSLDELPQFVNVLLGHMSIVGPRPVTKEEWAKYYGSQHAYTETRPGITGLWQISGRNEVDYAERVQMDAAYIKDWSFSQDFRIIFRTIGVVCVQRNGY